MAVLNRSTEARYRVGMGARGGAVPAREAPPPLLLLQPRPLLLKPQRLQQQVTCLNGLVESRAMAFCHVTARARDREGTRQDGHVAVVLGRVSGGA
eukprot:2816437-Rhodomonas_salina.1